MHWKLTVTEKALLSTDNILCGMDKKARRVGLRVHLYSVVLEHDENARMYLYSLDLDADPVKTGRWFRVDAHQTRDGKLFGAWHKDRFFRTREEADEYIQSRINRLL